MAELKQKDQLALHEFSVRYRVALAKLNPTSEASIDAVKDAVRDQYEQEQSVQRGPSVESPSPTMEREPQREPEEPEP